MEQIKELIRRYGLEEDLEHVIIPFHDKEGRKKRCFLLKRRFLRLVYPDGHFEEFPLEEVIEAIMRSPDLPLSEALSLLHEELDAEISKIFENEKEVKSE
ncbi:MAG: hypothetical protein M0Z67_16725 [Nitrospiraceae bacterium]|nr:hypothetical protein [Nitrospiraceae bacterium]